MDRQTNLVWIDLEMTGLNLPEDVILEIAVVITDKDLNIIAQGPSLVIKQPDAILDSMNEWCKKQHGLSGLTQEVRAATISLMQAEEQLCDFIKDYCIKGKAILCGNSIWQDKAFIQYYMPKLNSFFHYKIVDVSSIKELVIRWYPKSPYADIKKVDKHRALPDILESIKVLINYRTHFFISENVVAFQEANQQ